MHVIESTLKDHWDTIYNKPENQLSWFQQYPKASMDLVEQTQLPKNAAIIDIGGGDSRFAEAMVDKGYTNLWVLDISEKAIERARERMGAKASKIQWVVSDVLEFKPNITFNLWHDRAAFHFLTLEEEVSKYLSIAENFINNNGFLIIGTFSNKGPHTCSGLEVKQYSQSTMIDTIGNAFEKMRCLREDHITPSGKAQNFIYCSFRKK